MLGGVDEGPYAVCVCVCIGKGGLSSCLRSLLLKKPLFDKVRDWEKVAKAFREKNCSKIKIIDAFFYYLFFTASHTSPHFTNGQKKTKTNKPTKNVCTEKMEKNPLPGAQVLYLWVPPGWQRFDVTWQIAERDDLEGTQRGEGMAQSPSTRRSRSHGGDDVLKEAKKRKERRGKRQKERALGNLGYTHTHTHSRSDLLHYRFIAGSQQPFTSSTLLSSAFLWTVRGIKDLKRSQIHRQRENMQTPHRQSLRHPRPSCFDETNMPLDHYKTGGTQNVIHK